MCSVQIKRLADLVNKRLNSSEDFEEFQSYATQMLDLDTIYSLIDEKIYCEDGPKMLEYILVGLSVKPDAQKDVEKVYEYVLNAMNTSEIPEKMKVCLINRLSLELNKLSTEQLIKFINMCKKDIEGSNEICVQSWKELIPQILKIVSEIKLLTADGIEMTGVAYKELFINDVCRYKVQPNVIVGLALMFRRIQLTEKEHKLVIKSLCPYIVQMKSQEIPPLLQQILHFCSSGDFLNVFCIVQKYFDDKNLVHLNIEKNNTYDIEISESKELVEDEVLFLLEEFAKVHSSFVGVIIKYIKSCIAAPNIVFGPFMLAFLLTMSCCEPYESDVISLLQKLVMQSLVEVENTHRSCWLSNNNCDDLYDVYAQFQVFINSEISSYEKICKSLVNLSLSLLGTTSIAKKYININYHQIHQLGLFIIVSLVHKRSFITGSVLQKLIDLIITNPTSTQYLECLDKLCKTESITVIENNIQLLRLYEKMPTGIADKVTCAILPVLKISSELRYKIIMELRSNTKNSPCLSRNSAISGLIEILCNVRLDDLSGVYQKPIDNLFPGSFTQTILDCNSVDNHSNDMLENCPAIFTNKEIFLDIIYHLRQCLYDKSEIKRTFYRGLIRATSHHNELCQHVSRLIRMHVNIWSNMPFNDRNSLKFNSSISTSRNDRLIVCEPLEDLILLTQHVITNIQSDDDESKDLKDLFRHLFNFYIECNIDEIEVSETHYLLDIITNVAQYSDVIKQILCVYQAFIIYVVNSWHSPYQDINCCEKIQKLFSKYSHIMEAVMASEKVNENKDKERKVETTSNFIEPTIHLDFDVLYKFLSLLAKNEDWNSEFTVRPLKRNVKLWEFVLNLAKTHLAEIKNLLSRGIKPCNLYENLCKLTKLLYDYFLYDIWDKLQFSKIVVELGLECYLQIIKLVSSHYKQLDQFLLDSNQESSDDKLNEIFSVLCNIQSHFDKILEMNQVDLLDTINEEDDNDKEIDHKIEGHLIGCVSIICHTIKNRKDIRIKNILIWLTMVAEKYSFLNTNNSKEFLTLMLDMHTAYEKDPIILANAIENLCHSFGPISKSHQIDVSAMRSFKMITTWNRTMICPILCQYLCNELNYVLLSLSRIKAELNASQNKIKFICQDRLKVKEKNIFYRLVLVILATNTFTKTVIPLGPCTESLFNLLYQVYRTINKVTKHLLARSSYQQPIYKQALLGKLFKIVNSQLSPNVFKLIMFVKHNGPLTDKEEKSVQLKNQTHCQASIPRVVTELELFVKLITKLGKKCKDQNLIKNIKRTSTHDFRLNIQKLEDMLSKQNNSDESNKDTLEEIIPVHDRLKESQTDSRPTI